MPGPQGPRNAAQGAPSHQGPRMMPCGKPSLPRQMTALSWPTSLEDETEEDRLKDLKQPADAILSPKTPSLTRGWSGLSSSVAGGVRELFQRASGPRMQPWMKPPMLRSMTSFSWLSGGSSAHDTVERRIKEDHEKPEYPSSSDTSNHTNKPVLKQGASHISFASWQSGNSSGSKKNLKKKQEVDMEKDLEVTGERCINFLETGVVVSPQALNDKNKGQPNKIRTARFTLMTWLPKSLFNQFQRVANIYFLLICVLVMFPFSPKDWKSKVFPFMAVLIWTALKDLHEDRLRRRDDAIENNQKTLRFDTQSRTFTETLWQDIFCGDVLLVNCDEAFPADMVLLHAGGSYEAFISTISLDGETNLKERRPPGICDHIVWPVVNRLSSRQVSPQIASADAQDAHGEALRVLFALHTSSLHARMGKPEVAVTDVKGTIYAGTEEGPLGWNNFLPRGCMLRNTSWVLGVVIYIGDETKTRLNTAQTKSKVSNMQVYLNYCVWGLLISLVVVCLYSATMSALQEDEFKICCNDESWVIRLAIFLITFYHVVPMSLYVVFEMLKLLLGYQVNADKQMICPETNVPAMARTADLIEEMGQISFVFSDKTGTLTRNEMVFARCCINGMDPGDFRFTENEDDRESIGQRKICSILQGKEHGEMLDRVRWFFNCLAVCHTVQVQAVVDEPEAKSVQTHENASSASTEARSATTGTTQDRVSQSTSHYRRQTSNQGRYMGMSPDEVALVEVARQVGVAFHARARGAGGGSSATSSRVTLKLGDDEEETTFRILHELEFNSDRKRMSVVCEHNGEYYCITKGADSVMEGLATERFSEEYQNCLKRFSQQGLRTLVIAMKKVDNQYLNAWEAKYLSALGCLDGSKDARVAATAAEMEQNLQIVGISAVEDRLQDGVPEAIETVKRAGVRVWVLTGDKTETAVDIAKSCLLFHSETRLAYAIEAGSVKQTLEKLHQAKNTLVGATDAGLVLDGMTIKYALTDEGCQDLIYELGLASRSCVCCRLTPLQKRQLVELVHKRSPSTITLAIGDGANDVPMIEGAHLGIAVRGKEGAQAVQVSDVAIAQFRFLVPLLLCHGRRAYRRIATFLCYYLYKNVALAIGDVVWMHQDQYRGRIAFPEYLSVNYNFLFTSWHILFVLGFDSDVSDYVAVNTPQLYLVGPARGLFNWKVFTRWMLVAVYHGCAAWLVPNLWFGKDVYDKKHPGPFWVGSCASFTIIIFIALLKLLMSNVSPFKFVTALLPSLAALLLYAIVLAMLGYLPIGISLQPNMDGIPGDVLASKEALIAIFAVPPAVLTVDLASYILRIWLWPSPLDAARRRDPKSAS